MRRKDSSNRSAVPHVASGPAPNATLAKRPRRSPFNREYQRRAAQSVLVRAGITFHPENGFYRPARFQPSRFGQLTLDFNPKPIPVEVVPDPEKPLADVFPEAYSDEKWPRGKPNPFPILRN